MIWETIAEGTTLDTLQAVQERQLAKGSRLRYSFTVRTPLGIPAGRAFDLPAAERIFQAIMPEGIKVLDVYSPDNYEKVVVDCEVTTNPVITTSVILGAIATHWFKASLVAIGLVWGLAALITSIKIDAEAIPAVARDLLLAVVVIVVAIIVVALITRK